MILADSNFWLALTLSEHQHHGVAFAWIARATAHWPVSFCRSTQQSFLRLLSTRAVLNLYGLPPLTNLAAWQVYEAFCADPRVTCSDEPQGIAPIWQVFGGKPDPSPKLWMDAYHFLRDGMWHPGPGRALEIRAKLEPLQSA